MATTLTVQHEVGDYDAWRPAFDTDAENRRRHGCTQETVYRASDDLNNVLVVMEYPSREAALGFLGDPALKAAMGTAGLVSSPRAVLGDALAAQQV
jgi:quinol monooxygenase YgiN